MGRALVVLITGLAACASRARPPVGVTVVVDGADAAATRAAVTRGHVDGLVLRPIEPPPAPEPGPDPAARALAAARAAYYADQPSFSACTAALEPIDVPELLGLGRRELAARVLVWRAACAWGALDRAGAGVVATQLASFGLELPPDVGAVTPDVEAVLAQAVTEVGRAARVPVAVAGTAGARLLVDGRPAGCMVPCTTDVVPGDHVIAALGDGFAPAWRVARAPTTAPVTLQAAPASPAQAAAQWHDRIGRGLPPGDDVGVTLVARAAGDARVAYVVGGPKVSGAFVVDGAVRARVTRGDGDVVGLIHDLAVRGKVLPATPLYRQPRFWIAATLIAGLAAAVTTAIVYQPGTVTSIGVPR